MRDVLRLLQFEATARRGDQWRGPWPETRIDSGGAGHRPGRNGTDGTETSKLFLVVQITDGRAGQGPIYLGLLSCPSVTGRKTSVLPDRPARPAHCRFAGFRRLRSTPFREFSRPPGGRFADFSPRRFAPGRLAYIRAQNAP